MLATLEAKIIAGALGLVLLAGIFAWHKHEVSAAYKQGKEDEAAHILAKAQEIKTAADTLTTKISNAFRSKIDAENAATHNAASVMLVRGPGRASCPGNAGLPAAAGGSEPASGAAGAALPKLPYPKWDDLLAVRFPPAVAFAEQHDLNRNEVIAWRDWYRQESAAFAPPPAPKKKSLLQRIFN